MPVRQPQPQQTKPSETPRVLPPLQPSSDPMAFPLRERSWVRAETLRILGIDPGWANMGIVVLEQTLGGPIVCKLASHTKTESEAKKAKIRVSVDDARRLREIWDAIVHAVQVAGPIHSISAEAYSPFKAQGGNAWKSSMAYAVIHCYGFANNILVHPGLPADLKRNFGLSKSASKDEVGAHLQTKIKGLTEGLANYAKGKHEHITDAAGHAFLGLMDIYKLRQQTGVVI